MSTLVARGLRASVGASDLLHGVDVTVTPETRLGLVGPNGAGKSTLLRLLAGLDRPDAGTVTRSPPGTTVGLLPQEPDRRPGETLRRHLGRRTGVDAAEQAMTAGADALSRSPDRVQLQDAYGDALERWLALGGADIEERAERTLDELGLPVALLDRSTAALSGGQMARASLAATLLARFDVLLLDEPTNDLDLDGLARLEGFVMGLRRGLVVVSHDREFLARTITSVLELDPSNERAVLFEGGWDAYLAERAVARRHAREAYEAYADRRADLQGRVQSTRELSVRGALRARRRAPDNDRTARADRIEAATSAAGKVRSLETRLARLDREAVVEPRKEWELRLQLPPAPRSGDVVATLRGAVVQREGFRLGPVDLDLRWADRVVVVGRNGGGKTTLLQLLLGRLQPVPGTAHLGAGVVVGELDQTRQAFDEAGTVVDVLLARTDLTPVEAQTLLAKFGLKAAHVRRPASSLSPGERTRAGLALLMARGTNLLVLDEPTNHLDLPAIEQLEEALTSYDGTLLLVTHDRRLLDAVTVTRRLRVEDGVVHEVV